VFDANAKYNLPHKFWEINEPAMPLSSFYNDSINDNFTYTDLIQYLRHENRHNKTLPFSEDNKNLLRLPWIFDAGTKSKILEIYSQEEMRALAQVAFRHLRSPYFVLKVNRSNIIEDTLNVLQSQEDITLRRPLKVKFIGEDGVDEGGVKKEFFQILVRNLFDAQYGMFAYNTETDLFWFNDSTFEDSQTFELIGMIIGLAIYNNIILDIRFPNLIFKKLMNKALDFEDFRNFDNELAQGFEQMLTFDGNVEDTYCRTFSVEKEIFGAVQVIDLKENGRDIPVTNDNSREYVELYCKYVMEDSVDRFCNAMKNGFHYVAGQKVQDFFTWEEVQLLACGSDEIDFEALQESARYMDGFTEDSVTIKLFWEVAHELDEENKRKLLSFCSGSDRIPIRGLKELTLTISKNGDNQDQLPTSHTCYNHLLLPEYTTKEVLKKRVLIAIQNSEGFGLM